MGSARCGSNSIGRGSWWPSARFGVSCGKWGCVVRPGAGRSRSPPGPARGLPDRRTWSTGSSAPTNPTGYGFRTSPMSPAGTGSSIRVSSSTVTPGGSSAGEWRPLSAPNWCWTRSNKPSVNASTRPPAG